MTVYEHTVIVISLLPGSLFRFLSCTLPGPSASEVTTLRRNTNTFIIIIFLIIIINKSESEIVITKHDSCSGNTTATATVVAQTQLFIQLSHSNGRLLLLLPATRYHSNHKFSNKLQQYWQQKAASLLPLVSYFRLRDNL